MTGQDITMPTDLRAAYRLFQLTSPSLPTGAFTYSQGLEWAVDHGWIADQSGLEIWLESYLRTGFQELEIPIFKRMYNAVRDSDVDKFRHWSEYLLACRETSELRLEEINRGRAMAKLLFDLGLAEDDEWLVTIRFCQTAGFALAACRWRITVTDAALGLIWSWLENMVMAAVKTIPLGQTEGQRVLCSLSDACRRAVTNGLTREDTEIMGSCPAFALSSSLHETQYTRLFRS